MNYPNALGKNHISGFVVSLVTLLLVVACANVEVRKVPSSAQYRNVDVPEGTSAWTIEDQRRADSIKGFRYYLPRPFLVVKQEFPASSESFLVKGEVTDKKITNITTSAKNRGKLNLLEGLVENGVELDQLVTTDPLLAERLEGAVAEGTTSSSEAPAVKPPASLQLQSATAVTLTASSLQSPAASANFTITVNKIGLGRAPDAQPKHIRNLYLVPRAATGTAPESLDPSSWIKLPWPLYKGGADSGTMKIHGPIPGLKQGSYVLGVEFFEKETDGSYRRIYGYTDIAKQLLIVQQALPNLPPKGTTLPTEGLAPQAILAGLTTMVLPSMRARADAFVADIAITKKTLSIVSGATYFENEAEAKGKHVQAVAVAQVDGSGSINLQSEVRLPFDLIAENDTTVTFKANTVFEGLAPGSYKLYFYIKTPSSEKSQIAIVDDVFTIRDETFQPVDEPTPQKQPTTAPTEGEKKPDGVKKPTTDPIAGTPISGGNATATVTIKKNPATSPTVRVSDLFDILYLPDFTEQYAIQAKPRFSLTKMALNLENGWMLETVNMEIVNTKVGEFVYNQIANVMDLASSYFKLKKGLILPPSPTGGTGEAKGDGDGEALEGNVGVTKAKTVYLKIHVTKYAVPGVYPVLKPREIHDLQAQRAKTSHIIPQTLLTAIPPQTVVAFNVRNEITVEILGGDGAKPEVMKHKQSVTDALSVAGITGVKVRSADHRAMDQSKFDIHIRAQDESDFADDTQAKQVCDALTAPVRAGLLVNNAGSPPNEIFVYWKLGSESSSSIKCS